MDVHNPSRSSTHDAWRTASPWRSPDRSLPSDGTAGALKARGSITSYPAVGLGGNGIEKQHPASNATLRLRPYFDAGITPEQAASTTLPAHTPSAGLRNAYAGVGFITALTPRWILFGNAGTSRLIGDAAASPLTLNRSSYSAGLGLAYRCCRW